MRRRIDEQYTAGPFYGSRRITRNGHEVNRKRAQRLLRVMGLEAIHPEPKLAAAGGATKVYPPLLRDVPIDRIGSADIMYLPMASGFMYRAATINWFSRYVSAWRLSNTLDGALAAGTPEVFNTGQGSSSRPGRGSSGRGRTVQYEEVFLRSYESVPERERRADFAFSNEARLHQSLGYKTPAEVYRAGQSKEPVKE